MRMKKIVSFEIGDELEQYSRITFRLDLRVVASFLAVIILFIVLLITSSSSSSGHNSASIKEKSARESNQNNETTNLPVSSKITISNDPEMAKRLELIKNMTREGWKQQSEIASTSEKGLSMIQMLSTLWVAGLKDEYEQGKKWIEANYYNEDFDYPVYTFVAATEYMGSLLACYALTNDTKMLDKAEQIGNRLKVEFDTPTDLPNKLMFSRKSFGENTVHLAEAGGQHLEFVYLADMTNQTDMKTKVRNARTFLQNVTKPHNGLYMHDINVSTGKWESSYSSLLWPANVFYQYLVKSYDQSNGRDGQAIEMYKEAIDSAVNNSVISVKNGLTYSNAVRNGFKVKYMNYDVCYLGALLSLGAMAMQRDLHQNKWTDTKRKQREQARIEQHWTMAKSITETCHLAANKTETKLAKMGRLDQGMTFETTAAYAESYFVLWRLTHDVKYRDYAWELAQAIAKHCRTKEGKYYHLSDVEEEFSTNKYEPSKLHFLSSTLKYLYLTFSEDSLLPLDQWVFNRVGQPLPVCGKNVAYPAQKCTE